MMGNHNGYGGRNATYGLGNGNRNPGNNLGYGANNSNNTLGNNGYNSRNLGLESLCFVIIAKYQDTQSKSAIRFMGTPQATSCIEERELQHLQLKTKKIVLG